MDPVSSPAHHHKYRLGGAILALIRMTNCKKWVGVKEFHCRHIVDANGDKKRGTMRHSLTEERNNLQNEASIIRSPLIRIRIIWNQQLSADCPRRQILCHRIIYCCMWKRYVGLPAHSLACPKRPNSLLPLCRAQHSSGSNKINSCRAALCHFKPPSITGY